MEKAGRLGVGVEQEDLEPSKPGAIACGLHRVRDPKLEDHVKNTSPATPALHVHLSTHLLHQALYNGEPQSDTAGLPRDGRVFLIERSEDLLFSPRRDPLAGIGDGKF